MATFSDFEREVLVGAYLLADENGDDYVKLRDIVERYGISFRPGWPMRVLRSLIDMGYSDDARHLGGDELDQSVSLTPSGFKRGEELASEIDPAKDVEAPASSQQRTPRGSDRFRDFENRILLLLYREWEKGAGIVSFGRIVGEAGLDYERGWLVRAHDSLLGKGLIKGPVNRRVEEMTAGELSPAGMEYVEDHLLPREAAPASNRLVRFDHNSPEYRSIREGLSDIREAIRGTNDLPVDAEERARLVSSLNAAETLWQATQLKAVQIKIGIIMALEDAKVALATTAKAVAAGLLVDTIKAFVKSRTGIDLDHL